MYLANITDTAGMRKRIPNLPINVKVGSLTRNTTTASGTQAVTGVGFKPKVVLFLAADAGAGFPITSIGFDDTTTHADWLTTGSTFLVGGGTHSIISGVDGSNFQSAAVTSFDTDGFTLTWTKTGSPTGTITVFYLALR